MHATASAAQGDNVHHRRLTHNAVQIPAFDYPHTYSQTKAQPAGAYSIRGTEHVPASNQYLWTPPYTPTGETQYNAQRGTMSNPITTAYQPSPISAVYPHLQAGTSGNSPQFSAMLSAQSDMTGDPRTHRLSSQYMNSTSNALQDTSVLPQPMVIGQVSSDSPRRPCNACVNSHKTVGPTSSSVHRMEVKLIDRPVQAQYRSIPVPRVCHQEKARPMPRGFP